MNNSFDTIMKELNTEQIITKVALTLQIVLFVILWFSSNFVLLVISSVIFMNVFIFSRNIARFIVRRFLND